MKAGVAINPSTPLDVLDYVYNVTDYVIIMTVNPGFAGQTFIPEMYDKIANLKAERSQLDAKQQQDTQRFEVIQAYFNVQLQQQLDPV